MNTQFKFTTKVKAVAIGFAMLFSLNSCNKEDTITPIAEDVATNNLSSARVESSKMYDLGLTYTFRPSVNTWTSKSSNINGTCGSSVGGVVKARITSVDGDVAWVCIAKEDGTRFTNPGTVHIKVGTICGNSADLRDQNMSYANSYSSNILEIRIPFVIKPGHYQTIYPMVISANTRYHSNPITITASGWLRNGETNIQKNIINNARSRIGHEPGISITSKDKWKTDMSDGDGARWRNAINDYHNWRLNPGRVTEAQIRRTMLNRLTESYNTVDANRIIDRIIAVYRPNTTMPTTHNEIMSYMGVQMQCMEFVGRTSENNGGLYRAYGRNQSSVVKDERDWRPGMAIYQGRTHAMILAGVEWANNKPTGKVWVVETNWATTFSRPVGQIPWERRVASREFTKGTSHYVVKLEN